MNPCGKCDGGAGCPRRVARPARRTTRPPVVWPQPIHRPETFRQWMRRAGWIILGVMGLAAVIVGGPFAYWQYLNWGR